MPGDRARAGRRIDHITGAQTAKDRVECGIGRLSDIITCALRNHQLSTRVPGTN